MRQPEKSPERAVLPVEQVFDIADGIRPRFQCLVLMAAFTRG